MTFLKKINNEYSSGLFNFWKYFFNYRLEASKGVAGNFDKKLVNSLKFFSLLVWVFTAITSSVLAQETPVKPQQQRLKPNFSEEERRFNNRGFKDSFLMDSLNGLSDPLGGGSAGISVVNKDNLAPISAQERGILPAFDPTDVIIPRPGVSR